MSHDRPLCSDSYSKFDDPDLREEHVDEIARAVSSIPARISRIASALIQQFDHTLYLLESSLVADLLKSDGVNTRYLGLFYTELRRLNPPAEGQEETQLSWIVLLEMVSRTAAWRLREMWRSDIKACKHVRDTFCKNIAVKYLTDLADPTKPTSALQALIAESQEYFGFNFAPNFWEKHKAAFLSKCILRICTLAGLQMSESFLTRQKDAEKYGWTAPDDAFDIQEIRVKISQLPMVALAHARFTMNHLRKSSSFKRIIEAAQRNSLKDFRLAFANWIRFEFPVVGNVITACKNVPVAMCELMMTVCTEEATTMFKSLSQYWLKLDVGMTNGFLLKRKLLDDGHPNVAQLFLAYAKRYLPDSIWFLLLRMTFSIVHEDPLLLAGGILGDPTAEDIALLPLEEVLPILAQGRQIMEKQGKMKEIVLLSLVEANLRFYHDNFADKSSLLAAKALFAASLRAGPEVKAMIRPKCRFLDVTGDPTLLLLKIVAVGPSFFSPLPEAVAEQLSKVTRFGMPEIWRSADPSRKLSVNFSSAELAAAAKLAPKVERADLTVFSDALSAPVIVEVLRAWSNSLVEVGLPVIGFSVVPQISEALQKCKLIRTVRCGSHDRIQKHVAASGPINAKWLQTVTLLPLQ